MDNPVEAPARRDVISTLSGNKIKKGKSGWFWLAIAAVFLGGVALFSIWERARQPQLPLYETVMPDRGDIARQVMATGTVNPQLTIIVGSYVSGPITEIRCDYNTMVKAGQVCATIDARPYQTIVDQDNADLFVAMAQLRKDQANVTYTQLSYQRNLRLKDTDAVSQDTVDVARNLVDQAAAQVGVDQATIEQRKAALSAARINLDYTNIKSPVDGVVVSRNVTQGQTVAASFQTPTLFLIATDLTRMQVDTNISESDIGGLKNGQAATFTVDAFPDRVLNGIVTQIRQSPQTVQNVVTFDAVVTIDNADLRLKPGMTASLNIVTDRQKNTLRVPSQALRFEPKASVPHPADGKFDHVWVEHDGTLRMVPVKAGISDESYTAIADGDLHAGDKVVVGQLTPVNASTSFRFFRF
ncbi:efflux RND transporter periplasmic adaptor subunit [Rhizobium sp. P28RR-XV]|uniref:efflux RND transporter periplasmic adaptor subunit n=1 Tax=Rhizobium sp. P28RR-XV TaxID=2726737 RepID=UPI001FEF2E55|nr:efflux RND transporter periplasmic adaptor subunit [Rhizobium sp. P28RR-XV]